ncbi:MAG: response regulator transcription factor [Candidatus Pacebacteria bacterium]|nr:response regulator transcription factor [Candidatus Paceibacterota bacterium]MBP9840647.1 response regulator transcription factor [Candidatus Paceibacterota bacterium]
MRVLVIEDETKLADVLSEGLTKKGFAVDRIEDGEEALNRLSLHRSDYDLVILDLMLPSLSGDEVCRQARERGVTTPILILTARGETETKVDLLLSGADDYLVKPFSFDELLARIHALSRRPKESKPTILTAGDIELNPAEHRVTRAGKEIELTLKEFMLLEYFMQRPGEVVNREDLLTHLWDFNYESFSNVIDVHVKNLRKKLDDGSGETLLETVRGIGYRFRA